MKKLILLTIAIVLILLLCSCQNEQDYIDIYNRNSSVFDNVQIEIKTGYFYNTHEKFMVDEDTVGVTVYFSKEDTEWNLKGGGG